jgi:eukaryotic-like serine/threonine-protein kinase
VGGQFGTPRSLVWVNRQGREEPINLPPRTYTYPRLSPDGTRAALDIRDQENDIWIWDIARATLTRLTFNPSADYFPVWTPDSRRIIFFSQRSGHLFWQLADGTGAADQLTTSSTTPHYAYSMSPDGKSLVFQENSPKTGIDLSVLLLGSPSASPGTDTVRTEALLQTAFTESNAEISPGGQWMAYQSNESGSEEIYVRPFPKVEAGHWQVSTGGGTRPAWARNGQELFYLDSEGFLTAVPVQTKPGFGVANPARLFNTRYFSGFGGSGATVAGRTYDVSADGQRFLMIKDAPPDLTSASLSVVVVLNWFEELKQRVP